MGDLADSILLGMIKGGPVFWHIPLFLGWLFLYLAVYPVTLALKRNKSNPIKSGFVITVFQPLAFISLCLS